MTDTIRPWGRDSLMVLCAVRYCLGRQSYIVSDCAEWLVNTWGQFPENVKALIQREVEEAFQQDDRLREEAMYDPQKVWAFPLGADCDRAQWTKVRCLWRTPNGNP